MSEMTNKMSQASASTLSIEDRGVGRPKKGERFRCQNCGMEVQVTADCHCKEGEQVHFHCCGQELQQQ